MNGSLPPFADTPEPPYVAVIFSSLRTDGDNGYVTTRRGGTDHSTGRE